MSSVGQLHRLEMYHAIYIRLSGGCEVPKTTTGINKTN